MLKVLLVSLNFVIAGGNAGAAPVGGDGTYTNMPVNFTNTLHYLFPDAIPVSEDAQIGSSDWDIEFNGSGPGAGMATRVTDQTHPFGTDAFRSQYYDGLQSGVGAGGTIKGFPFPAPVSKVFLGAHLRHSAGFEFHGISNKWLYFLDSSANDILFETRGDNWWQIWSGSNIADADHIPIDHDSYIKIEVLYDTDTEEMTVWLDGVEAIPTTDVSSAGLADVQEVWFSPTWGGAGSPKSGDDFRWQADIFLAWPD